MEGQQELFTPADPRPRKRTVSNGSTEPRYAKYQAKNRYPCDFCKLNQVDDVTAPIARQARYRRTSTEGVLYLCHAHANDQRRVDGLKVLRAPR